ncbi:MAG: hypothetical protein ACI36X_07520 [Bacteroidaceae bacterium]
MKRTFLFLLVALLPLLALPQGIITRPTKKPSQTTTPAQKPPKKELVRPVEPKPEPVVQEPVASEPVKPVEPKPEPAPVKPTRGTISGHEWVDLGLSVKWATMNVGASSPSDYDDYFAWGETSTKTEYTSKTSKTFRKSMGNIAGNVAYDAARANWGGTWRLPTKVECEELVNQCIWTWTTQGGHNGYLVKGMNGNTLFLPAAGRRFGSLLFNVGESGNYWSSTPFGSDTESVYGLYLGSSAHGVIPLDRGSGYSVRPVSE